MMVDDRCKPGTLSRSPETRFWSGSARGAPAGLIQDLRWLRQRVLERLESLEILVRQYPASTPLGGEVEDLERTLNHRLAELEDTERQLRVQAERMEKEWSASLTQLEADRSLLAEAWERVERQRIEYVSRAEKPARPHAPVLGPTRAVLSELPPMPAPALVRPAGADSDRNQPVARAILRQFQTLCSDVRRNAQGSHDPR